MKVSSIIYLVVIVLIVFSSAKSNKKFKVENLYSEIFKINIEKYGDKFYLSFDINMLDSNNILSQYTKENYYFLDYLVINCVSYDFGLLQGNYSDSITLKSLFYDQLKSNSKFNQAFLPSVYKYLSEKGITIDDYKYKSDKQSIHITEVMRLGIRFFFPDKVEDKKLKGHICVGINGINDYSNRNCELEAFVFSAIFNNVVNNDKHGVYKKYREILDELSTMELSNDEKTTLLRAQGAMWYELYKYDQFKQIFVEEYRRIGKWMNFNIEY